MHINNFIKIHPFILKILSKHKILTSIKGHNSVVNELNWPICNPKPLIPNINDYAKFEKKNLSKNTQVREWKLSADGQTWTDGRTLKRFGEYNKIPHHLSVVGYKKNNLRFQSSELDMSFPDQPKELRAPGHFFLWT